MAHESFKRRHLNASKFRGVCEISREIYWDTKDPVIREKAMAVRWKAVEVDAELRNLKEFFEGPNPIGKRDRSVEELDAINAERQQLFDEEEHQGLQGADYQNHLDKRDPDQTLHEALRELFEVSEDERVLEANHMATRMLLKISEYQKRRA